MNKAVAWLKWAGRNILVFLIILVFLDIAAILVYKTERLLDRAAADVDPRARLPNYRDLPWAPIHFAEFDALRAEYRSYVGWRRQPFEGQTIQVDQRGIRVTPQHPSTSAAAPLVVFLGGSTMWGSGSDDSNTIPACVSRIAGGACRTLNLAESGYNALQGYICLELEVMQGLRPAVVVSYDGVNNGFREDILPYRHSRDAQIRARMKGSDSEDNEVLTFTHYFFRPIREVIRELRSDRDPDEIENDPPPGLTREQRNREKAGELLESWLAMLHLCEQHGAYFLAVLQPNAAVGRPKLSHLPRGDRYRRMGPSYYKEVRAMMETPRFADLRGHILDATEVFDRSEAIYIDFCHVSPNGNRIMAEWLYARIQSGIERTARKAAPTGEVSVGAVDRQVGF